MKKSTIIAIFCFFVMLSGCSSEHKRNNFNNLEEELFSIMQKIPYVYREGKATPNAKYKNLLNKKEDKFSKYFYACKTTYKFSSSTLCGEMETWWDNIMSSEEGRHISRIPSSSEGEIKKLPSSQDQRRKVWIYPSGGTVNPPPQPEIKSLP